MRSHPLSSMAVCFRHGVSTSARISCRITVSRAINFLALSLGHVITLLLMRYWAMLGGNWLGLWLVGGLLLGMLARQNIAIYRHGAEVFDTFSLFNVND